MTDTSIDEAAIREILDGCKGVTPGPWSSSPQKGPPGHCYLAQVWGHAPERRSMAVIDSKPSSEEATATAAHIARLDPDTVRALCTLALSAIASRQAVVTEAQAEAAGAVIEEKVGAFADMSPSFYPWLGRRALEAALAAPVRDEPKGWVFQDTIDPTRQPLYTEDAYVASVWRNAHGTVTAVYASPAPALPEAKPVGLIAGTGLKLLSEGYSATVWPVSTGGIQDDTVHSLYASPVQVEREAVIEECAKVAELHAAELSVAQKAAFGRGDDRQGNNLWTAQNEALVVAGRIRSLSRTEP